MMQTTKMVKEDSWDCAPALMVVVAVSGSKASSMRSPEPSFRRRVKLCRNRTSDPLFRRNEPHFSSAEIRRMTRWLHQCELPHVDPGLPPSHAMAGRVAGVTLGGGGCGGGIEASPPIQHRHTRPDQVGQSYAAADGHGQGGGNGADGVQSRYCCHHNHDNHRHLNSRGPGNG